MEPLVSWSKKGGGESMGAQVRAGEVKTVGWCIISATTERGRASIDNAQCGGAGLGKL
jgi:hypothetical protein